MRISTTHIFPIYRLNIFSESTGSARSKIFTAVFVLLFVSGQTSMTNAASKNDSEDTKGLPQRVENLEQSVTELETQILEIKSHKSLLEDRVVNLEDSDSSIVEYLELLSQSFSNVLDELAALSLVVAENQEQIVVLIERIESDDDDDGDNNGGGDDGDGDNDGNDEEGETREDFCNNNYCTSGQEHLVFNYALSEVPKTFPINLPSDSQPFEFYIPAHLIVNGIDFNNIPQDCLGDLSSCYGSVVLENADLLNELLINSDELEISRVSNYIDDDYRAFSPTIGAIQVRLTVDTGVTIDLYEPITNAIMLYKPIEGTGNRANGSCTYVSFNPVIGGFGYAPNIVGSVDKEISGGTLPMFGPGPGFQGMGVCGDTPSGTYDVMVEFIDGLGGKIEFPMSITVSDFYRDARTEEMMDLL